MVKPIGIALLVAVGVCSYLLIYRAVESPEPSEPPALQRPGATFGGTYRRELGDHPATLDPALVTNIYGRAVVSQLFDGLVQIDAHLRPLPALAEFWEASRDGRTWTFTVRRGVRFHHGREVTAHDVVYSLTRLLHPASPLPATELFRAIQGAKAYMQGHAPQVHGLQAVDRYTVRLVLEEPLAPTLALLTLAHAAVVPREEVEKSGDRFGQAPVGTGPFRFVRWEPHREIVLAAHEQYYEGRPFLDGIVFKIAVGSKLEERFAAFLQGDLEESIVPRGMRDEVRRDPQYRQYHRVSMPERGLLYLGVNTQRPPFDDRRVRQAFNYAVDKAAIVREITKIGTAAGDILPPGLLGHDPDLQGYPYQPAQAKRLLAEAGYPDGIGFPVVQLWSIHQAESTKAELAAYQRYLADLGVQVEIHFAPDWPTYKAMLERGELPMFRLMRYATIPDPDYFLFPMLHSTSPTNYTFYRNPQVDERLAQAKRELLEERRTALYREVARMVLDEAPWINQHHSVLEYLYQPYVQGMEDSVLGHRLLPMKKVWFKQGRAEGLTRATTEVQSSR